MDAPSAQKELVKLALKELLEESFTDKKGVLYEAFLEVIEDLSLSAALKEARKTPVVSREEVFMYLEKNA